MTFNGTYDETTAAGHTDIIFRGNYPGDPYLAAGGEEVSAWDELSALYSNCRVLRSRFVFSFQNLDADHGVTVILVPSLLSTALSNSSAAPVLPYAKSVLVQHPNEKTLSLDMTTVGMAGRKQGSVLDDDWVCLSSSAPTRQWYIHAIVNGAIGHAALNGRYSASIFYTCEWYGLQYLSQT
jgi:hypothetical protein